MDLMVKFGDEDRKTIESYAHPNGLTNVQAIREILRIGYCYFGNVYGTKNKVIIERTDGSLNQIIF